MSETLTDAQVAALARAWQDGTDVCYDPGREDYVKAGHIQSLALEVQQARQRRCGACVAFEPASPHSGWPSYEEGGGWCNGSGRKLMDCAYVPANWSCADFTPKEAR